MGVSLKKIASHGRNGDTEAIHVNKREIPLVDAFLRALGGAGTRNPDDGGLEYFGAEGGMGAHGRTDAARSGSSRTGSGRADRDQQNNTVADAAQSAMAGHTTASAGNGPVDNGAWTSGPVDPNAPPGGGTFTSNTYSPGAVGNFPDANAAAVADMLSNAIPGVGALNTAYKGANAVANGKDPLSSSSFGPLGDALGADAGPQRGWAPDRNHGQVSSFGSNGSAQGSPLRALRLVTGAQDPSLVAALTPSRTYSSSGVV